MPRSMTSEHRFPLKIDWQRVQSLPEWQRGGSLAEAESPLVAFPLRSEWDALHPADRETFPEPLRRSTDTGGTPEAPSGVLKLQRDAQGANWVTEVTYAVGYTPHATHGRPGEAPKPSWALRMARGDQRAVAVHRGGAWESFRVWGSRRLFTAHHTLAAFTDEVAGAMVIYPSAAEWARMLVKYPLKPTRKQWEDMREAH